MTNAEWKKLFSRLRTLRWLVRIKRYEAQQERDYYARSTHGRESVYIGLMSSHRQRTQFTNTMNDIGVILYSMQGGNIIIRNLILLMITEIWRVSSTYPDQTQVTEYVTTKVMPVWDTFRTAANRELDAEKVGPAIVSLDSIIDSSAKDYLPKIMMLKLAL